MRKRNIFLDSGAYSAMTQNAEINIDNYINYIKKTKKSLYVYANLDVIGNAEASYKNWEYMKSKGVDPLPVFHVGSPVEFLKKYIEKSDYIAIGGVAGTGQTIQVQRDYLDRLWSRYLVDSEGYPKVKVHAFGITSIVLLPRYPWFSADSTSWIQTARFGGVLIPIWKDGKYVHYESKTRKLRALRVFLSIRSPLIKQVGKHFNTYTKKKQEQIKNYFDMKGFKIGKSTTKERIDENGDTIVEEVVVEEGLCNNYIQRSILNALYYQDLESAMPKWPWKYKREQTYFMRKRK